MAYKIQFRRDTAANWESVNPVLSEGEVGHDLTNGIFKLGDGVSNWQSLPEFDSETKAHTLDFHSDTSGFATADPSMDGTAAVGVSDKIAREDHVHPTDTSREPANANIQSHISSTENPHGVTTTQIGAEPANANIQSHISSTTNPHNVTAAQAGAVAVNTAITGGTHTKITYDAKGLVTAGENISASDVPALDASKISTGVFDIARIPAAAIERMVPVADQAARFALTTVTVQLGDTVKQLDTGIMYVVIDTANLANAAGYSEYTAATAAAVPWSGVQSKPTTRAGYGITDAAASVHTHGNITNAGAIGSTAGIPVITGTSGVLQAGSFGSAAGTYCQGNDSRLSNARTPTAHTHGNITNTGAIGSTANLPVITGASGVVTVGSYASTTTTLSTSAGTAGTSTAFARQDHTHTVTPAGIGAATSAHTHGNVTSAGAIGSTAGVPIITGTSGVLQAGAFGTAAGTYCQGNDSRLSDARTPTAHTHGNITNTGYIGTTAGLPIVTSTSGIVAAGAWYASTPAAATTTGGTGASTSPARGDHAHPSRIATSAPASPVNGDIWMV